MALKEPSKITADKQFTGDRTLSVCVVGGMRSNDCRRTRKHSSPSRRHEPMISPQAHILLSSLLGETTMLDRASMGRAVGDPGFLKPLGAPEALVQPSCQLCLLLHAILRCSLSKPPP